MGSAKGFDRIQVRLGRPMVVLELLPGGQLAGVDRGPLEIIQVFQRRAARTPTHDQLDLGSFLRVRSSEMCGFGVRRTFAACQWSIIGRNPTSARHFLAPQFVMLFWWADRRFSAAKLQEQLSRPCATKANQLSALAQMGANILCPAES